jgi:hypothetical protein
VDINIILLGEGNGNATFSVRRYREKYPNRKVENRRTILSAVRRLRNTRTFHGTRCDVGCPRSASIIIIIIIIIIINISGVRMRWAGHVTRMGETRNSYSILVGNPEGKRPLGGQRCRWVNNIKIDLRETNWDGVDWIEPVSG